GTWPQQQVVSGTLRDIVRRVSEAKFKPPAVIVVGETVRLRERLRWFDNRPLSGKRVLVTRSREQASQLSERLRELGAETLEAPAIEVSPPNDFSPMDRAIRDLTSYGWVVFTSVNGVNGFFRRLAALGKDTRALGSLQVAAVGPATAERLTDFGVAADYVPTRYLTSEVAAGLIARGVQGHRVLLPRTDIVGEDLTGTLVAAGATVDQVVAYRTLQAPALDDEVLRRLRGGEIDLITFTSSSTVRNSIGALGSESGLLSGIPVASIGPVTSATAREAGLQVAVEAAEHTVHGLVTAILEFVERQGFGGGERRSS
ncbi:MAG: uroporphyrinogen-III synthase, partial [Chloroflexota bacterium]